MRRSLFLVVCTKSAPRPPILGEHEGSKPPELGVLGPDVLQQLVDLVLEAVYPEIMTKMAICVIPLAFWASGVRILGSRMFIRD